MDIQELKSFEKKSFKDMPLNEKKDLLYKLKLEFILEKSASNISPLKIKLIKKISRLLILS